MQRFSIVSVILVISLVLCGAAFAHEGHDDIPGQVPKGHWSCREIAELAEKFNNTVYEQSDSLKPAAELIKLARASEFFKSGRTPPSA